MTGGAEVAHPHAAGAHTEAGAQGNHRRRPRHPEANEPVDELAQETKRVSLLEREEQQLKGKEHVSRLLFVFGTQDDKKVQGQVEQEFLQWQSKQEGGNQISGVLFYLGQAAVSMLEGPTDLLFKALELFQALTQEVLPVSSLPSAPADVKVVTPKKASELAAQSSVPRAALIGAIRILYFTELHGVRVSTGWCSFAHSAAKQGGPPQTLDDGAHETVFLLYKKLLTLCLKVQDNAGNEADPDKLQGHYRKLSDSIPTQDEVAVFLSKQAADSFFSFPEFQKVFVKPFQLVLNSELLWPMPPALSY